MNNSWPILHLNRNCLSLKDTKFSNNANICCMIIARGNRLTELYPNLYIGIVVEAEWFMKR